MFEPPTTNTGSYGIDVALMGKVLVQLEQAIAEAAPPRKVSDPVYYGDCR